MATTFEQLPAALSGERRTVQSAFHDVNYYYARPEAGASDKPPLLLIHSVNAAGSAYEVKPLYEHYRKERPVYALDLPGFGFSDRSDRIYTVRLMVDAIHAVTEQIRKEWGAAPIDALALSLGSEFLARAASEQPGHFRSLGLISATGLDSRGPYQDAPGTTRGNRYLYWLFRFPLWDEPFFAALTVRPSIRYFLQKSWGSKDIDQGMWDYDYLTTHQPGARFAPYYFVAGHLFSRDITSVYESLRLPVWVAHGTRGDFQDYSKAAAFAGQPNWSVTAYATGALPHFETLDEVVRDYDEFLGTGRVSNKGVTVATSEKAAAAT